MPLARRFAAALAILGAGLLACAIPASAHGKQHGDCVNGHNRANLVAHIDAMTGDATVKVTGTAPLCDAVDVLLSVYKVPDAWDGSGFPGRNNSAVPQNVIATDRGTLKGHQTLALHVDLPKCGNVQADVYFPPEIAHVGKNGHPGGQFIAGQIWSIGGPPGKPAKCVTPPSPPPTTPPATKPTTKAPAPPVSTPTTPPARPIPVPPGQAPAAPPRLAETGSSSTVPLTALGAVLLGLGLALTFAGRRRTA